nr:hypothetical protein BaRGS_009847 [Batillaria attramentaria]
MNIKLRPKVLLLILIIIIFFVVVVIVVVVIIIIIIIIIIILAKQLLGKGVKFDATFRAAKNFPVDLYFLFDVSATMASTLKQLSELAIQMADAIKNISTNYQLGYGVFQDKVILPFTSTHPVRLKNPFPGGSNNYAPAFAFDHMLNLTQDLGEFRSAVNESLNKITGNLDRPEGGFDAIMQAIVCKKMGWRDNSRQIIIFGSDARMHYAGDGKLAGLITPNDEQCHLTEKGGNEMSEKQDYPSVGQISAALDRTKKYIIFAVKESIENEYKHINKRVSRSTHSALTKENNIVDIVQTKYRVRFKVQVRAERCPADPADRVQTVTIAPSDFRLDTLVIKVELLCECDCQLDDASSMVTGSVTDDPSGNSSTDSCYGQIIYVEDTEDCGESPDLLIVVLGIVGGVVAVGLLLLILWKILTMLFDKMEYAHFERELNTHKWAKRYPQAQVEEGEVVEEEGEVVEEEGEVVEEEEEAPWILVPPPPCDRQA